MSGTYATNMWFALHLCQAMTENVYFVSARRLTDAQACSIREEMKDETPSTVVHSLGFTTGEPVTDLTNRTSTASQCRKSSAGGLCIVTLRFIRVRAWPPVSIFVSMSYCPCMSTNLISRERAAVRLNSRYLMFSVQSIGKVISGQNTSHQLHREVSVTVQNLHLHPPLDRESRWGTTDDLTTSFLHFSLFPTALWDLANSRPVHSLILSSHLFCCCCCCFCLLSFLSPFPVPCKVVLAKPDKYGRHVDTTSVCVSLRWSSFKTRMFKIRMCRNGIHCSRPDQYFVFSL